MQFHLMLFIGQRPKMIVLGAITFTILFMGLIVSWIPSHRALAIDPVALLLGERPLETVEFALREMPRLSENWPLGLVIRIHRSMAATIVDQAGYLRVTIGITIRHTGALHFLDFSALDVC